MDVAEQIVVMKDGAIEQVGTARELYEEPKTEFVMEFVGEVNNVGGAYVRPHDLDLSLLPSDGGDEVMVERVSYLGFEVRVELALTGGGSVWAQVTRAEAEQLELQPGQIVWARPRHAKVFENGSGAQTAELTLAQGG